MANTSKLISLFDIKRYKSRSENTAPARGRQSAVHRQPQGDGYAGMLSGPMQRTMMQRHFTTKLNDRHAPFMHSEIGLHGNQ